MGLAVIGKQVIGPYIVALRGGRSPLAGRSGRAGGRRDSPILRRIGDPPHIFLIVKRNADQKLLAISAQRQTAGNTAGYASNAWQVAQQHRRFERQSLRAAKSAALRTHHKRHTLFGEGMLTIHAGDDHGNLHPQSCAAADRLGRVYLHLQAFRRDICVTL